MSSTVADIPFIYHFLLTWFEPFAALNGAFLCVFWPSMFLYTFTTVKYRPDHQIMFDQLAATYIFFAFIEAVVLRITNELKVWKAIVFGILLCDVVHLYGAWGIMGTESFLNPSTWRPEEWINFSLLYGPGLLRICLLLEVGFPKRKVAKKA
ncbi:hypothetical protein BDV96DRAFT_497782 [Lophiotrema nucula]|uniref:DUF7704 domain-containing protein n=1 Tax=Lophiotrema nucula TaxID=690887 RepID=A0A6A5Z232_9PLEO|nr:hypothetical protein BDV96DRAFT_497782 [Lophiotrema nucula]